MVTSLTMRYQITLLLMLVVTAFGDDAAIKIKGSKPSAKGDELVLIPQATTIDPNEFIVLFRKARSKEIVGADCVAQFGGRFSRDELPIKTVVWSPTGEYAAFDLRTERHYTRTIIYRVANGVRAVEIPEYWKHIKSQLGSSEEFRGGQQTPIRWIDNTHLEIKESGSLRDDTGFDFRVILELTGTTATFRSAYPK